MSILAEIRDVITHLKAIIMNSIKTTLAALALTLAATAGAQTLKMTPQVVGVTAYEASTAVNLVVVKPEIKLDNPDPSIFTVNTNGTERNVISVYPSDARGAFNPEGEYLALGLDKASGRGLGLSKAGSVWKEEYSVKVELKKGKVLKWASRNSPPSNVKRTRR